MSLFRPVRIGSELENAKDILAITGGLEGPEA